MNSKNDFDSTNLLSAPPYMVLFISFHVTYCPFVWVGQFLSIQPSITFLNEQIQL